MTKKLYASSVRVVGVVHDVQCQTLVEPEPVSHVSIVLPKDGADVVPASGEMASQCAMPDVVQVESALPGCEIPTPQLDACVATNVGIGLETSPDLKFVNCGDVAVFAPANSIPNRICDVDYGLPLPQLLPSCSFLTIAEAGQAVAVSYLVYQAVHPAIAALVQENGGDTVQVSYSPEASGWVPKFGDCTLPDASYTSPVDSLCPTPVSSQLDSSKLDSETSSVADVDDTVLSFQPLASPLSQTAAGWGPLFRDQPSQPSGVPVALQPPQVSGQECKQQ